MRDKAPYVLVCVPNGGTWCDETAKSMAIMFSYFAQNRIPGVSSMKMGLVTIQGSMVAAQRHLCVKKACQTKDATHVLFIDSDMAFPRDTVHRLLAHEKDIVGCNCTTRREPILPVAYDFDDQRIDSRARTGLEKVRSVGCAVMLIRLEVFKKVRPPFFLQEWLPSEVNYCGEDVYFCQAVQKAGYDVWIDHDLSIEIKHIGAREWGYDDVRIEDVEASRGGVRILKEGVMP